MRSKIYGIGSYVPEKILDNKYFISYLDTSEEWIITRTGIRERRKAGEGETTSSMAYSASLQALAMAGEEAVNLDWIIFATVTPDYYFPSASCLLQANIGASKAACIDVNAGCSGFVYALSLGDTLIRAGEARRVLVAGADALTRITDYEDRQTAMLFGDGAGCVLLGPCLGGEGGFIAFDLGADGSKGELIILPAGGSSLPPSRDTVEKGQHTIKLKGREVFRFATTEVPGSIKRVLDKAGLRKADWLLLHQANNRIIEAIAASSGYPKERVPSNIDRYGNTSAASIPILLDELWRSGAFHSGEYLILSGFGSGLTWATALYQF